MQKVLSCLAVLIPLGCSEYRAPVQGAGGDTSTVQSAANGGSDAGSSDISAEGGTDGGGTTTAGAGSGTSADRESLTFNADSIGGNLAFSPGGVSGDGTVGAASAGAPSAGTGATAGSSATAGASGTIDSRCGIPAAGSAAVAKPSGTVGGFRVIDWAGFKGAVSFTFDDGNSSQVTNYTKLKNLGVHYTFFLIGKNATSYKTTWQQAVVDGSELGNHTQYHLQGDPTGSNVAAGQQTIETTYNVKVYTMAAPYGNDYTSIAPNYHFLNRGVSNGLMKPNNDSAAFNTPCFIPALGAKTAAFDAEVKAARDGNGWKVILVHGFTGDSSAYNPVDVDQFTQAVLNAKASGDLWIDSFVNVGAYWRGQAAISKAQTTTSGSDQIWTWTLPAHFPPGKCVRATVSGGTLTQNGNVLPWNDHGYYEIALDAGAVTLSP